MELINILIKSLTIWLTILSASVIKSAPTSAPDVNLQWKLRLNKQWTIYKAKIIYLKQKIRRQTFPH